MRAFVNCDIFDGKMFHTQHALLIAGKTIEGIVEEDKIPEGADIIDLKGSTLSAGYLDLQVNGGGGVLLNDTASEKAITKVLDAHVKFGTTSMFPTVFTSKFERMEELLSSAIALKKRGESRIAGLHFEGPIINSGKAGVHDKNNIRDNEKRIIDLYKKSAQHFPTLVTLAPEMVEDSVISDLSSSGVLVFAGHTNATYEEATESYKHGLKGVTHLYNASSGPSSRAPGIVGATLVNDQAFFSIIVDGFHVHFASVLMALKCKPKGKAFLVTDAMPAVGFDGDKFMIGDLEVVVSEGMCQTKEGVLAGSALDLATAVRNCVQKVGVSRPEAIKMATSYPADFAGLSQAIGSLGHGMPASFVVSDNEFHVKKVFVLGVEK